METKFWHKLKKTPSISVRVPSSYVHFKKIISFILNIQGVSKMHVQISVPVPDIKLFKIQDIWQIIIIERH